MLNKSVFVTTTQRDVVYSLSEGQGVPLVFLNGLSDAMETWADVVTLSKTTRPSLLIDLPGQGESLVRELARGGEFNYHLSIEEQVAALRELLDHLGIEKFGLVGFSYGGGVALGTLHQYQERVEDFILFLPFILRLDLSFPLSRLWVAQFDFLKSLTPQSMRHPFQAIEKSYERFIEHYMNFRYLNRIPDERFRQVAVELSRGIMEFNSFDVISQIPEDKLILVTSGMDTLVPQSLYLEFWCRIPEHQKRAWVNILNGEHLLLEQAPDFVADLLNRALSGDLRGVIKTTLLKTQKVQSL